MTTQFEYDFENGTNGNEVTNALSGWDSHSGTAVTWSDAWSSGGGALSARLACTAAVGQARISITADAAPFYRAYWKFVSLPSANSSFVVALDSADGYKAEIQMTTGGLIRIRNASYTAVDATTHVFAAGDIVRVEWNPVPGGTQTCRLFWGANIDGTTPDDTLSGTTGGSGTITYFFEGINNAATWTVQWDNTKIDDTTWVGPESSGATAYQASGTVAAVSSASLGTAYAASGTVAVVSQTRGVTADPSTASARLLEFHGAVLPTNPADLATNTARWGWAGFGYSYPGGSFVADTGGMRINWSATDPPQVPDGNQLGFYYADTAPLIVGHRIKIKAVINVPAGSPDVRLTNAYYASSEWCTTKDQDVMVVLYVAWPTPAQAGIGIESEAGARSGSVLVKSIEIIDISSPAGEWHPSGGTVVIPPVPDPPDAAFTYTPASGDFPLDVDFTNTSTFATTYAWTFGDGATSTATSPSHTYTSAGVRTVILTATGPGGVDTISHTVTVTTPTPATKRFAGDPGVGKFYIDILPTVTNQYAAQDVTIRARLSAYAPAQARTLSLHRIYDSGNITLPSPEFNWALSNNRVPLVSFKGTPSTVTAGGIDSNLDANIALFNTAKAQGKAVWWTYFHEPEDNWPSGTAAAQYRAACRYIHAYFKAAGCDNLAFATTMYMGDFTFINASGRTWWEWFPDWKGSVTGGATKNNPNPVDFYARGSANAVVDILGMDTYSLMVWNIPTGGTPSGNLTPYTADIVTRNLTLASNNVAQACGSGYPIAIGEFGLQAAQYPIGTMDDARTQAALDAMRQAITDLDIVGLSWWNQPLAYDWQLLSLDPNRIRDKWMAALCSDADHVHPPIAWNA